MNLTTKQLKQMVKEELRAVIEENWDQTLEWSKIHLPQGYDSWEQVVKDFYKDGGPWDNRFDLEQPYDWSHNMTKEILNWWHGWAKFTYSPLYGSHLFPYYSRQGMSTWGGLSFSTKWRQVDKDKRPPPGFFAISDEPGEELLDSLKKWMEKLEEAYKLIKALAHYLVHSIRHFKITHPKLRQHSNLYSQVRKLIRMILKPLTFDAWDGKKRILRFKDLPRLAPDELKQNATSVTKKWEKIEYKFKDVEQLLVLWNIRSYDKDRAQKEIADDFESVQKYDYSIGMKNK
jgi:hypothetical protein